MILLIDQGNSRTKWKMAGPAGGLLHGGAWDGEQPSSDDLAVIRAAGQVDSTVIATVISGGRNEALADSLASLGAGPPRWVDVGQECGGVRNGYREPMRLGVDRWLALLGARDCGSEAWLVVDAGTALTVDALGSDGQHHGGYIVPGFRMQTRLLSTQTSSIGAIGAPSGNGWGRTTSEAVSRGVLLAMAALVDRASVELVKSGEDTCRVIVTGGDARLLLPHLHGSPRLEPDLVFRGMLVEAREKNKGPG